MKTYIFKYYTKKQAIEDLINTISKRFIGSKDEEILDKRKIKDWVEDNLNYGADSLFSEIYNKIFLNKEKNFNIYSTTAEHLSDAVNKFEDYLNKQIDNPFIICKNALIKENNITIPIEGLSEYIDQYIEQT